MTYDPILESRPVPRIRVLNPLRPPRPGTALVLVRYQGEAVAVLHGQPIPEARWSAYQWAYLVDIADHRLVLELPLLSRDPNFAFRGRVSLTCRVIDPVEVITRGIRDMGAALREHVQRMLRRVSRDYDIGQFHQAEEALNDRARTFSGDSAVRLRAIEVELLVDDQEIATSGRAYRDLVRETRLNEMRRERSRKLLTGNPVESLLAEIVEREGPRAALAWIAEAEGAEREQLLRALQLVLDGNPDQEPFDLVELQRLLAGRLAETPSLGLGGNGRTGRIHGVLELGRRDGGADRGDTVTGEVVEPAGPPADEPDGGAAAGSGSSPPTGQPPPGQDRTRPRSGRVRGVTPDAGHHDKHGHA